MQVVLRYSDTKNYSQAISELQRPGQKAGRNKVFWVFFSYRVFSFFGHLVTFLVSLIFAFSLWAFPFCCFCWVCFCCFFPRNVFLLCVGLVFSDSLFVWPRRTWNHRAPFLLFCVWCSSSFCRFQGWLHITTWLCQIENKEGRKRNEKNINKNKWNNISEKNDWIWHSIVFFSAVCVCFCCCFPICSCFFLSRSVCNVAEQPTVVIKITRVDHTFDFPGQMFELMFSLVTFSKFIWSTTCRPPNPGKNKSIIKGVQTMKCKLWTETLDFSRLKVSNSRFAFHGLAPP